MPAKGLELDVSTAGPDWVGRLHVQLRRSLKLIPPARVHRLRPLARDDTTVPVLAPERYCHRPGMGLCQD